MAASLKIKIFSFKNYIIKSINQDFFCFLIIKQTFYAIVHSKIFTLNSQRTLKKSEGKTKKVAQEASSIVINKYYGALDRKLL